MNDAEASSDRIARDFDHIDAPISKSTTASERLRAASRHAGDGAPDDHDAHHIVPASGGGPAGDLARESLAIEGVHLDGEKNVIRLRGLRPDVRTPLEGATSHIGLHDARYYWSVALRLKNRQSQSVESVLAEMAHELDEGRFRYVVTKERAKALTSRAKQEADER